MNYSGIIVSSHTIDYEYNYSKDFITIKFIALNHNTHQNSCVKKEEEVVKEEVEEVEGETVLPLPLMTNSFLRNMVEIIMIIIIEENSHLLVADTALASAISLAPGVPIFLKRKLREFSSMTSFLSSWGE